MTPETILDHDGVQQTITEWALDYGLTPTIIIARIERGLSVASAITTPMMTGHKGQRLPIYSEEQTNVRRRYTKTFTVDGETKTIAEWASQIGITPRTFTKRLLRMPIEQALAMPTQSRASRRRKSETNKPPGVADDLRAHLGTGAGNALQERAEITFQKEAAE